MTSSAGVDGERDGVARARLEEHAVTFVRGVAPRVALGGRAEVARRLAVVNGDVERVAGERVVAALTKDAEVELGQRIGRVRIDVDGAAMIERVAREARERRAAGGEL